MTLKQTGVTRAVTGFRSNSVFDWQGTLTKILNAEAGLYEIDGQVGLCLAYQPAQKWGGGLRPGAEIQVSDVIAEFSRRIIISVNY